VKSLKKSIDSTTGSSMLGFKSTGDPPYLEWCHGHEKIGQSGKYQYYKKNTTQKNAMKKVSDP